MNKLIPDSFREIYSGFLLLLGIIFSFVSLKQEKREHALRIAAISFCAGIALFANNPWCYFATIVIIATAITELDFLQNLAAIICGAKEYFAYKYKTEYETPKEREESIKKETKEIEEAKKEKDDKILEVAEEKINKINIIMNKQQLSPPQFAFLVEEFAFKFLENKFGKPIQRHVRIIKRDKTRTRVFDGIVKLDDIDIIFEIKVFISKIILTSFITRKVEELLDSIQDYQQITKRKASLRMVCIGNFTTLFKYYIISRLPDITENYKDIEVVLDFYSFEEIGLNLDE